MHFGIEIVPFGDYADPKQVLRLARAAEDAGWEGIWLWDHLLMPYGVGDPWVMFSAIAARTERIKLIPGVAALPRYRPHMLARTLASLDLLSQGRLILGAGAGAIHDEFKAFGEPKDYRTRLEMLDESLDLLKHFGTGEVVVHQGKHYPVEGAAILPTPVQKPYIPVWIGGTSQAALKRAVKWQGWIIGTVDENNQVTTYTPGRMAKDIECIREARGSLNGFEVAIDGASDPGQTGSIRDYAEAGVTWYFETIHGMRGGLDEMLERVRFGPPKI